MKRETDPLNLRSAFEPMPDGCYNALMKAARSVKEERTVKRAALRTIAIAVCIILAAMAAYIVSGGGGGGYGGGGRRRQHPGLERLL